MQTGANSPALLLATTNGEVVVAVGSSPVLLFPGESSVPESMCFGCAGPAMLCLGLRSGRGWGWLGSLRPLSGKNSPQWLELGG